jgi:hypothetical protein
MSIRQKWFGAVAGYTGFSPNDLLYFRLQGSLKFNYL